MTNKNKASKAYSTPQLERHGSIGELSAGGSGSMQEGTGFIGMVSGVSMSGSGPGLGLMNSRP